MDRDTDLALADDRRSGNSSDAGEVGNAPPVAAGGVRPLERHDIPAVARLFLKTFRRTAADANAALSSYLQQLYLDSTLYDPQICSLVHVDHDGTIDGFLGKLARKKQSISAQA